LICIHNTNIHDNAAGKLKWRATSTNPFLQLMLF
jgi:hypothetical protein